MPTAPTSIGAMPIALGQVVVDCIDAEKLDVLLASVVPPSTVDQWYLCGPQGLVELVQRTARHAPQKPYLSNLTGTWMTVEAALDPNYWGRHLRETVRFADGLAEVMNYPEVILLEVGPAEFARQLRERSDVAVTDTTFSVSLIPTTLALTTLGGRAVGGTVNLEVDVLAKYVERLLTPRPTTEVTP